MQESSLHKVILTSQLQLTSVPSFLITSDLIDLIKAIMIFDEIAKDQFNQSSQLIWSF